MAASWLLHALGHLNPMYDAVEAARELAADLCHDGRGRGVPGHGAAAVAALWWNTRCYRGP